jgi:hypothetical protein
MTDSRQPRVTIRMYYARNNYRASRRVLAVVTAQARLTRTRIVVEPDTWQTRLRLHSGFSGYRHPLVFDRRSHSLIPRPSILGSGCWVLYSATDSLSRSLL